MRDGYFISEPQDTLKVTGFNAKLHAELLAEMEALKKRINDNLSFIGQAIVIQVQEGVPK